MPRKPPPTFSVRFLRRGLYPEQIPWRRLATAVDAINRLATGGGDEAEGDHGVRLIGLRRGSAVFQCYAPDVKQVIENLKSTGRMLESGELPPDAAERMRPLEDLSRIARSLGCAIELQQADDVLARICADSYDNLVGSYLVRGETALTGRIERVGGATDLRCAMRLPERTTLLYCDVADRELARELGGRLYEEVTVTGMAAWVKSDWSIASLRITSVLDRHGRPLHEALRELRDAGADAWDRVEDPDSLLEELRG